ncbi:exported hypothetical protein [Nitrospina gracilis 3/211]|uniref:Uncharacterized protein n=1 Tax=Nitrospina gracilis (strain 3/211) TaxID=1266370 RepID=M1Z8T8_NITG3|nr:MULTISPECIES: hypothetical protein [Nitrospina]MCF8722288.1 hypothetical protein [Nitrospina sp. Nb-3]CCQ89493.1 exported hypothetical protein [Nitrospina gracilis 3/211]
METHRANSSSAPRAATKRHWLLRMMLVLGSLFVFAAPVLASHGAAHHGPKEFGNWESYFNSSHAEHPSSSTQAKNPFTPYLPGVNGLVLDKAGMHCLLSAKVRPDAGSPSPECRLFGKPGEETALAPMTQEWNLFRRALTGGQARFFETTPAPAPAIDLNTLTGYLIETYGVSRLH